VDRGDELRKRVQPRLGLAPVVFLAPVADELLQPGELRALRAIGDRFLVRPSRRVDALAQVVERRLRHLDLERAYRLIFRRPALATDGEEKNKERTGKRGLREFPEHHGVLLNWNDCYRTRTTERAGVRGLRTFAQRRVTLVASRKPWMSSDKHWTCFRQG